jgi:hypothetical protein
MRAQASALMMTIPLVITTPAGGVTTSSVLALCEPSQVYAVVGVPERDAVDLQARGAAREFVIDGHQSGARFGSSVVVHDVNADRCMDLLVGEPIANHVHVLMGAATGPGTGESAVLEYAGAAGDGFGTAVAAEMVPPTALSDGLLRVWVGAPGVDVDGRTDAGAVVYYTVGADLQVSEPKVLTQNSPGVPGAAERGDRFGEVLAALSSGVAVGVPGEDVGSRADAGALWVLPAPGVIPAGAGPYLVTQDSPGIPGGAEAGDGFAAALDMTLRDDGDPRIIESGLWVGVPREDLGTVRDAGLVQELGLGLAGATGLTVLTQDTRFTPGVAESGDRFGAALEGGGVSSDEYDCFATNVQIGVPGEDIGTIADAGAVNLSYSAAGHRCYDFDARDAMWHLGTKASAGDFLGSSLGIGGSGAPGMDVGPEIDAGAVSNNGSTFTMNPVQSGSHYGAVMAKFCYRAPWYW